MSPALCRLPPHEANFVASRIIVVDDVITTGAKVEACAHVLKRTGGVRVDVLALAPAVEPSALLL